MDVSSLSSRWSVVTNPISIRHFGVSELSSALQVVGRPRRTTTGTKPVSVDGEQGDPRGRGLSPGKRVGTQRSSPRPSDVVTRDTTRPGVPSDSVVGGH